MTTIDGDQASMRNYYFVYPKSSYLIEDNRYYTKLPMPVYYNKDTIWQTIVIDGDRIDIELSDDDSFCKNAPNGNSFCFHNS